MTDSVVVEKATVVVVTETSIQVITVGIQGPEGPGVVAMSAQRRHAFASPHSYCAIAPADTLDSASGWTITRIHVDANGTTTVTRATGAWADRATLTYT